MNKWLVLLLGIFLIVTLAACDDVVDDLDNDDDDDVVDVEEDDNEEVTLSYSVEVVVDEYVSGSFYKDSELTILYTESELIDLDSGSEVYFELVFNEGYELNTMSSIFNLSVYDEETNVYVLSNIVNDVSINVSSKEVEVVVEENEYLVTFGVNDVVDFTIYSDEGVTVLDTESVVLNDENNTLYFSFELLDGYEVSEISNSLGLEFVLVEEGLYKIENITEDLEVAVVPKLVVDYNSEENIVITFGDEILVTNSNGYVDVESGVVTISNEGTYYITGSSLEGSVVVNTLDSLDVDLILTDLSLVSSLNSPIYIESADKVNIIIEGEVSLVDNRSDYDDASLEPNACIYSNVDLDIEGLGTLYVDANYYNGIVSKDDLDIEEITLYIDALNNGIKGNDSVDLRYVDAVITASNGDGIKTENSHVTDSGNQKGSIEIVGGTFVINSLEDGIDAAYDLYITENPVMEINTATYADLSGDVISSSNVDYYLITSTWVSTSDQYVLLVDGEWIKYEFLGELMVGRSRYYYYSASVSEEATRYELYVFDSGDSYSTTDYIAKSVVESFPTTNNSIYLNSSSIIGAKVFTEWVFYDMSGTSASLPYSAKALKADNTIIIDSGIYTLNSTDDAVHANDDVLLDNGSYGIGSVVINGGTFTVDTQDDAFHGDYELIINSGDIDVTYAYEGLEAPYITINGGNINLYVKDDAINAAGVSMPSVLVTGGNIYIETMSNDPDCIDSNGIYTQTGGYVVAVTPVTQSKMGGVLDTDSTVSITGGTFIGLGMSHSVPTNEGNNLTTGLINVSLTPGTYSIVDEDGLVLFTFDSAYYNTSYFMISSDQLVDNETYSIVKDGTVVYSWTQ